MKIRNKLSIVLIPIILVLIVLINLVYVLFFVNYVSQQETVQKNLLKSNIVSFLDEKKNKYLGSVNDWAHWDDTYMFVLDESPAYEVNNMMESTFTNLDLNFFIVLDANRAIQYQKYYSMEGNAFSSFPSVVSGGFSRILGSLATGGDASGIYRLGERFYFIAASNITDSLEEKQLDKTLVFGREIDGSIISEMEAITGYRISSIETAGIPAAGDAQSPDFACEYDKNDRFIENITFYDPNPAAGYSIAFHFVYSRDLYKSAVRQVTSFCILNTAISIVIGMIIMVLLWKLVSKPFLLLTNQVKKIDLAKEEFVRLPETGNDEFFYLRKTINSMLSKIEIVQNELRHSKEELHATLFSVGDGVIAADKAGNVQFLNPVAEKMTGWSMDEACNKPMSAVFSIINEYTRKPAESPDKLVFKTENIVELSNHTLLVSKDGTERPIEDTAAPIRDKDGQISGCVLVFRDFSERKEKQMRIEYLSYHDQLTGVYNRRFFMMALERLNEEDKLPLSLLYIDVNGLKTINDAFGHRTGDELIEKISAAFQEECGPNDIIARTGGDEFIILLPATDISSAEKLARRIKERIAGIKVMDIEISVSIGWAAKTSAEQNIADIIKQAEDAMYQKKIYNTATKRSGIIQSILNSLLIKNPREEAHSKRVSRICVDIGKALELGDDELKELKVIGELHDIGKIAIDDSILNKEGSLSESERAQIEKHPETGYRLLCTSSDFIHISDFILAHHERWDGKGYPRGIRGEDIPWQARIVAIADSYDAMTSNRPYRKALGKEKAIAEIAACAGTQFDPALVKVFVEKVAGNL